MTQPDIDFEKLLNSLLHQDGSGSAFTPILNANQEDGSDVCSISTGDSYSTDGGSSADDEMSDGDESDLDSDDGRAVSRHGERVRGCVEPTRDSRESGRSERDVFLRGQSSSSSGSSSEDRVPVRVLLIEFEYRTRELQNALRRLESIVASLNRRECIRDGNLGLGDAVTPSSVGVTAATAAIGT